MFTKAALFCSCRCTIFEIHCLSCGGGGGGCFVVSPGAVGTLVTDTAMTDTGIKMVTLAAARLRVPVVLVLLGVPTKATTIGSEVHSAGLMKMTEEAGAFSGHRTEDGRGELLG